MNTFPVLLVALCVYAIGYRYYSAFIAAKAIGAGRRRTTPAHLYADGHNYVASPKWVLFGHHFAAIAGAGPLVGPTLAAQFGFAPGFLWMLFGAVLGGCVQDFTVLVASVRHSGRSLADIARTEISPFAGLVAMIAVLFILLVTLAGLGIVVVNALANSPWGVFTIGMTIPIAVVMGLWMFKSTPGKITDHRPQHFWRRLMLAAVIFGKSFADSSYAHVLTFSPHAIVYLMAAYGFIASVLPVWFVLEPRDYLSTYMKLGTIALLILGVFVVHPDIRFPAFTQFIHGGGPIIKGKLFPFLFVTIACGAISGFHSLVSSGTTPKMLDKETDARFIGYGAMVCRVARRRPGSDRRRAPCIRETTSPSTPRPPSSATSGYPPSIWISTPTKSANNSPDAPGARSPSPSAWPESSAACPAWIASWVTGITMPSCSKRSSSSLPSTPAPVSPATFSRNS